MRILALAAFVILACNDAGGPAVQFTPQLEILAGDAQQDTVTKELPNEIQARVSDSVTKSPRANVIVNWVVVQGGGSVFAAVGSTNQLGVASQRWTLGPIAGAQVLEARAIDPGTGQPVVFARINATALPGPLVYHGFDVPRLHVFGDTAALPIEAEDAHGNVVDVPPIDSPDGLTTLRSGATARVVGDRLGRFRLVAGDDTLRVIIHPPAGPYVHRRTIADTTWEQTGTLAFSHWSTTGNPCCADSAAVYIVSSFKSVKRVLGVSVDSTTSIDLGVSHTWGHVDGTTYPNLGVGFVLAPSTTIQATNTAFVGVQAGRWVFVGNGGADSVFIR